MRAQARCFAHFPQDADGDGVLDGQEADPAADLDANGVLDQDQSDLTNVVSDSENFNIGISIGGAEDAAALAALQSEDPEQAGIEPANRKRRINSD